MYPACVCLIEQNKRGICFLSKTGETKRLEVPLGLARFLSLLDGVLWSVLGLLTLLPIEELAFLILSRVIWQEQHGDEMMQKWIEEDNKTGGKRT